MNGREFIRRAKRYAKKTRQEWRFEATRGKGSHGLFFVGRNRATIKRGEISPSLLDDMLKQLKIKKGDF